MTLVEYQIRENLKLSKDLAKKINTICEGLESLKALEHQGNLDEVHIGMWTRDLKDLWPYSVFILGILEDGSYSEIRDKVLVIIEESNLKDFWLVRPILNVSY